MYLVACVECDPPFLKHGPRRWTHITRQLSEDLSVSYACLNCPDFRERRTCVHVDTLANGHTSQIVPLNGEDGSLWLMSVLLES